MPSMKIDVAHTLGKDAAVESLKGFLGRIREKYQDQVSDFEEAWAENVLTYSFKTYGFKISGVITVTDDEVSLDGKLPIAAMAFRGKIEQSIRHEIERMVKA